MTTAITLYAIAALCAVLVAAFGLISLRYYANAKRIAPYLIELEALKRRIAEAQSTLASIHAEIKAADDALANARRSIADGEAAKKWLEENGSKIEALRSAEATARQNLKTAEDAYAKRQKELDELTQRVADAHKELNDSLKKRDQAEVEKSRLDEEAKSLRAKINSLGKEKTTLEGEVKLLEAKRAELDAQARGLEKDAERLKQQIAEGKAELSKRQKELNELTQRIADAHKDLKDSLIKRDQAEVAKSHMEEEAKSLRTKVDSLAKAKTTLEGDIKSLEGRQAGLGARVQSLEKDAERLKQQIADEKAEAAAQSQAVAAARKELAELEGRANAERSILSEIDERRKVSADCWADLEKQLVPQEKMTPFIMESAKNINEQEWLKKFQLDLENCGIIFNKRTIMAFHTGLKCADISPLVVLAGISGTGKSLLPELYAAALGMNFLAVSVQPRWDGPQDMFGFYNYMEGRYKATELSRLLWQFDRHNNPKAKGLKNFPMNLVLLDEMNLARVEYYFSDLLSKLEIRRGLDFNDRESRAKAEMEIESSASAAAVKRPRLFIAPNTLFVGTMNEDETTQSLSDKVLDRANVLRFGRPEKLGAKPDKKKFLAITADNPVITEGVWEKWRTLPSDGTATAELRRVLEPLNAALGKAGRPFAHRVWLAMETYILNYPGGNQRGTQAFKHALADQIEMKVLPKLNGIELEAPGFRDAETELTELIDSLNDEKLREAFKASCDPAHNSFFKWRGVMR